MTRASRGRNKADVLEALDTPFDRRDYAAPERYWSGRFLQHSAHIDPGRDGLVNLVRLLPDTLGYENQLIFADGNYVAPHDRFSANGRSATWISSDIAEIKDGKLTEPWNGLPGEVTKAPSNSELTMFGNRFPQ